MSCIPCIYTFVQPVALVIAYNTRLIMLLHTIIRILEAARKRRGPVPTTAFGSVESFPRFI